MLKKLRVPPPTLCPRCRMQRRMAWRLNFRPVFYKKQCSAPGHTEKVISFYDENNPHKVYDDAYYRSDSWDAIDFGTGYDPNKPIIPALRQLFLNVPHQTLHHDPQSINSDYVVVGVQAKNCYYVSVPVYSENLQYGSLGESSKDSIDFVNLDHCEQCYSCFRVERCYNCAFCLNSNDCINSYFLFDCRNCQDCFGCFNLRNKSYCWFNEQLSAEEYKQRLAGIDLGSYETIEQYRREFIEIIKRAIYKNLDIVKSDNVIGNQLRNCKNCADAYLSYVTENARHVCFVTRAMSLGSSDLMDFWGGGDVSLCYESGGVATSSQLKFSILHRNSREVEYSTECTNIEYCFGCSNLRNKKFCIFNKQYSEEEYWPKVDELKAAMLERGEYGEMLPAAMSPFPYNDSNAQVEFPLSKEEVLARGWQWHEQKDGVVDLRGLNTIPAADLPDNIKDVSDDILHKAVLCTESGRPFRLTKFELDFYRNHNIPLPRLHPDVRIARLLEYRLPYRLYDDTCKKCDKAIKSGYDPSKGFNVYCESCYQNEVI